MKDISYIKNPSMSADQACFSKPKQKNITVPEHIFEYYPALTRIKVYVEKNLSESISLQKAANVACLEKKYFSSYFHSKTGTKYSDWLANLRIERAKVCLCRTNDSIVTVALESGFSNVRTFQRVFKKFVGLSPMSYKQQTLRNSNCEIAKTHDICRVSHTK